MSATHTYLPSPSLAVYVIMNNLRLQYKIPIPDANSTDLDDEEKLRLLPDGRSKPQSKE